MNIIENGDVDLKMYLFESTQFYSTPRIISLFVGPSVCPLVTLNFFVFFCGVWPLCSCPNDLVTSITAPAHQYTTGVAVDLALFVFVICWRIWMLWVDGWLDIGSDGQID